MRKTIISALMTALALLLVSCSNADPRDTADKIRTDFSNAQKIVITSDISADYGDKVFNFKISCTQATDKTEIEIKEPENLAGIKAVCIDSGYELSFDGVQVTTGVLTRNGVSPAEALPALISQWQTGYISGAVFEKYAGEDAIALDTHFTDTVTQRTWFDLDSLLPVHSEISQDGKVVIYCDFENIIME